MKRNVKLILGGLVFVVFVVTIILIVIDVSSSSSGSTTTTPGSTTTTPGSTTTTPGSTTTTSSSGGSPPPTKHCNLENGTCTKGIYKKNCVGGERLCGINMGKPHPTKATDKTCKAMLDRYGVSFFTCNPGYTKSVKPVQGIMCQFTCEKCEKN